MEPFLNDRFGAPTTMTKTTMTMRVSKEEKRRVGSESENLNDDQRTVEEQRVARLSIAERSQKLNTGARALSKHTRRYVHSRTRKHTLN